MRHGSVIKRTAKILSLAALGAVGAVGVSHAQNIPNIVPLPPGFVVPPSSGIGPVGAPRSIGIPNIVPLPPGFGVPPSSGAPFQRTIGPVNITPLNGGGLNQERRIMQLNPLLPPQAAAQLSPSLPVTPGFTTPGFPAPFANTGVLNGVGALGGVPNSGMTLGPLNAFGTRTNGNFPLVGTTGVPGAVTTLPGAVTTRPGSYGASVTPVPQRGAPQGQPAMAAQPAPNTGAAAVRTANSRRHMVRGAMEVATARRYNVARSQGALTSAVVVKANGASVWVKIDQNGTPAIRQIPSANVFFYRAGELLDGANFPNMATPGESVMVIDSSRMPL